MEDCVFYQRKFIFIVYVDESIFSSPSNASIDQAITYIGDKFDIEYQGTLDNYIGFNVQFLPGGKINILQNNMIYQITQGVNLVGRLPPLSTPAKSSVILAWDISSLPFDHMLHYHSIIGDINFPKKSTRVDISYATQQISRFF